jgi:hypothetical protein
VAGKVEDECVSHVELHEFMKTITEMMNMNQSANINRLEGVDRWIAGLVDQIETLEIHVPPTGHHDDLATKDVFTQGDRITHEIKGSIASRSNGRFSMNQ